MTTKQNTPFDHIASIRRTKFGIGAKQAQANPLSDDLHRAIDHLATGLYSKQTHFILELIQNAEDNPYGKGVTPDLQFILLEEDPTQCPDSDGALVVVNNESGFRPEDVDALCAVGATTKKKREGYIGEKGIGFKSVFVVSRQPHLISNGYQFRFDEEPYPEAQLGYIVPEWIQDVPSELERHLAETCILLPLKRGKKEEVRAGLRSIAPETILFLSKLEGLTIQAEDGERIEVIRDNSGRPLIQFMKGGEYAEYWLAEREVEVLADLEEEKRAGITTRKISVALPLADDGGQTDRVFAFLPTEVRSGMPFLINADFLLTTSREGVLTDRPWNKWLRDCIAPTFVEAFEGLLSRPEHRARAYSFIPLKEDVSYEFFQPVVEAIHQTLRDRPVIWVEGSDDMVEPPNTRTATKALRQLIDAAHPPEPLQRTPLVRAEIQVHQERLHAIGVKALSPEEIIECLKDDAWLHRQEASWFASLYEYLSGQKWATAESFRALRLLPLEQGKCASTAQQAVYFPEGDIQEVKDLQRRLPAIPIAALLNSELYALIRDKREVVEWLKATMGVAELTPGTCCVGLAQALNRNMEGISVADLVLATRYLRDRYPKLEEDEQQAVVRLLPVALADGSIVAPRDWSDESPLVVPENLDPKAGWQWVFPDPNDRWHMVVLSEAYLDPSVDEEERDTWALFFDAIGATDAPMPGCIEWQFRDGNRPPEDVAAHVREFVRANYEWSYYPRDLSDSQAPLWLRNLAHDRNPCKRMQQNARALCGWLENHRTDFNNSFRAVYHWFYRTDRYAHCDSEFKHCMLAAAWVPTTKGFRVPNEVFLDKPELREIFGNTLPYATVEVSDEVAKWLGIRRSATGDQLLDYLKNLASRPADQADARTVAKIYAFLSGRENLDMHGFHESPLILAARPAPRWVKADQTVWPDLSAVFGDTYAYLEPAYGRSLRDFFVEKVGVADEIGAELYGRAWLELAKGTPDPEKVVAALERIFPEMLKVAVNHDKPDWWPRFLSEVRVWTQDKHFRPAGQVYIPDDDDLRRLFAPKGIAFAWRPEKSSFHEYAPLYQALGVRALAENVKATVSEPESDGEEPENPALTAAVKEAIITYQRAHDRPAYERAKQAGTIEALLKTREVEVDKLTIRYALGGVVADVADGAAFWDREQQLLYRSLARSQEDIEVEMPAIVARALNGGRTSTDLENFIGRVLGASDTMINAILRKGNLSLPKEESRWLRAILDEPEIPEEPIPGPEPPPENAPQPGKPPQPLPGGGGGHEEPGKRKPRPPRPPRPRPRDRLRSYVEAGQDKGRRKTPGEGGTEERRAEIERAGIEFALQFEEGQGRKPEELEPLHEGWDIDSYEEDSVAAILDSPDKRKLARRIEVKATEYAWDGWGVGLTAAEYRAAQEHSDSYYLYVVEHALDPDARRLHVFRNPAAKIAEYRFDDAWTQAADESVLARPESSDGDGD